MAARKKSKKTSRDPDPAAMADSNTSAEGDAVTESASTDFPVVGIGASAGGLSAFEAFFSSMDPEAPTNMAFVLVQHLAPDHKSMLADLVRRYTSMEVFQVEHGMKVRPNCTYIIPPGRDMTFLDGTLQLHEQSAPRGRPLTIDMFFRSLAEDQRERAICIVLSGTGSDGAEGVRAIKAEGGMVMAQNPASTDFDSMPRSAIATGMVDYELPPAEMVSQLITYVSHAFGKLPPSTAALKDDEIDSAVQKIFIVLHNDTGHDFSQYKPSTILRRIRRRMAVCQIESIHAYVSHLQKKPSEVQALFNDLLIGVTSFFRDPEAFRMLEEKVIPKIFADKPANGTVRIWSAGCATGEEAYSVAMLLQERLELLKQNYKLQVFATDIDDRAITTARAGVYPGNIAADVSEERLARFFISEADDSTYCIKKNVRDTLIFSGHNVIKDPPFSKIDLIICRNLLIYMNANLQKKLIPHLHYALNPGGFLFLGGSETIGEFTDLFAPIDRRLGLYRRKEYLQSIVHRDRNRYLPPTTTTKPALPEVVQTTAVGEKISLRNLTVETILKETAPTGVLVDGNGDILYIHGRTGLYLEPAQGLGSVNNVFKMARKGLGVELTAALRKAKKTGEIQRRKGIRVKSNGKYITVNLTIRQVAPGSALPLEKPLYLIILEEAVSSDDDRIRSAHGGPFPSTKETTGTSRSEQDAEGDTGVSVKALERELLAKEEHLRTINEDLETTNEELETANEELQSFNEEMQSINEELQSTNEELETSQEELQSVNEELTTVNTELENKVVDLSWANNDIKNLLDGTGIATVFVDHQLRILRFTPTATAIINLIPNDVGRPVGHIVSNLKNYDRLSADTKTVLDNLVPILTEVQTREGLWYTLRIQPYRTLDNVIEGAVITFIDSTEAKKAREKLLQSEERFRLLLETMPTCAIYGYDVHGTINYWNKTAESLYLYSAEEAIGSTLFDLIIPLEQHASMRRLIEKAIVTGENMPGIEKSLKCKDDSLVSVYSSHVVIQRAGAETELFSIDVDLSEQKQAEMLRAHYEAQYHRIQKAEGLERMAEAIAHLFNNQLQVVMGNLELALDDLAEDAPVRKYLISAMGSAHRSAEVSGLMLTYIGHSLVRLEPLDLSEACSLNLSKLETLRPDGITLESDLLFPGPVVKASEKQIEQLLTHLVVNSWEAIGEDGGSLKVVTKIVPAAEISRFHIRPADRLKDAENFACLEVSDTGCGIVEAELDKIFDPFYSTKFTGRGLGLAVVMGLVKIWGAMINVQSTVGEGSRFAVYFPLLEEDVSKQYELYDITEEATSREGAVLAVDDDIIVLKTLEAVLHRLGFRVYKASSGKEAIQLFEKHRQNISCVITDLSMPGMDGWDVLDALRRLEPHIPVVLASGYSESQVMEGEHAEQPQAFLQKPYSANNLKETLHQVLGKAKEQ